MKITNLLFWVQENKVSEKFYKKLGFDIRESTDAHSVVALGDFSITLVTMRDEKPFTRDSMAAERGKGMYVYVHVDDVDKKYEELVEAGFQPSTKPRDWEWGNREFVLKDPDGYKFVFWHSIE